MKNILHCLAFYAKYPGLHSFKTDRATLGAIRALERRGYLQVYWSSHQAQYRGTNRVNLS